MSSFNLINSSSCLFGDLQLKHPSLTEYQCENLAWTLKIIQERNDKILEEHCSFCDYKPTKTTNYKLHYLNKHATKEEREKDFPFYCKKCDFGSFNKVLLDRHLETDKHTKTSTQNIKI